MFIDAAVAIWLTPIVPNNEKEAFLRKRYEKRSNFPRNAYFDTYQFSYGEHL